ncbi:peptidoglycan-binding protein [Streptomyces sp. NPDC020801]|uniref:peptidoglycan-binding domain-containing protein n=1 Tax=unclassified Streptomyces TaxID=2593676 RepID=UPI0037AEC413
MKSSFAARRVITVAAVACVASLAFGLPAHATTSAPYLRYGAHGEGVKCVQRAVRWAGMGTVSNLVSVDGVWGPRTQDAVVEFQEHYQLNPDGVVGRETGQRMWNVITQESEGFEYCFQLLPTLSN